MQPGPYPAPEDTEALAAISNTYARDTNDTGICVADGYGLRIAVDRGHLVVADGLGPYRRTRRYARATHGLRRVVVLGHTGSVTLEALTWCHRLGIEVAVIDADATVQFTSAPNGLDDARLRRAQAAALGTELGLAITRELLHAKLTGQAALLRTRFGETDAADTVSELRDALSGVSDIDEARQLEASAAALYWNAWSGRDDTVPTFVTRDRARIPDHWTTMEGRRSVLASANANRRAERPTNSLINYVTALCEIEATTACHIVALDPALGVLHLDARDRQSFSLDVLEPLRPLVEGFVLDLLADRTFRRSDFAELPDGHVRILAPLTHELAETMPRWRKAVAPWAERVANLIGANLDGKYTPTTRLTGANHRAAQAQVKARKERRGGTNATPTRRQRPTLEAPALPFATCVACGAQLERKRHLRCRTCWANQPGQDEATRRKRGRAIAATRAQLERWRSEHPDARTDPEAFRREILPRLAGVTLAEIMRVTGMAKSSASMVRSGARVPALRHWTALASLGDLTGRPTRDP